MPTGETKIHIEGIFVYNNQVIYLDNFTKNAELCFEY